VAPKPSEREVDFANSALIQAEALLSVYRLVEHGLPVGPASLNSLCSLIESAVIHDVVYYQPRLGFRCSTRDGEAWLFDVLQDSSLVKLLEQSGVLRSVPEARLDEYLSRQGRDYRFAGLIKDFHWAGTSFYIEPGGEKQRYRALLDLVRRTPLWLQPLLIVPEDAWDGPPVDGECKLISANIKARLMGFSPSDLDLIQGLNLLAYAYFDLARNTGMNLVPFFAALPHHIGAIRRNNQVALALYHKITRELEKQDSEVEAAHGPHFRRVPIPPLCQLVLRNCKDSPQALGPEILNLRHRHRSFRQYLTGYERAWNSAKTRSERMKLQNDFNNAWQGLIVKEKKPSTRWIYTLWDILKDPHKILQAIGDKLAEKGRHQYVVNRVNGLHDFWRDLCDAPPSDSNRALASKLFPNQAHNRTWEVAAELAATLDSDLTSPASVA
jgi:hypothetical protein